MIRVSPLPLLSLIVAAITGCAPTEAQSTVGNGTVILPSAGQRESYALNETPQNVGSSSTFATTHYHRGNFSGIGGSTAGTESVTSESSPASVAAAPQLFAAVEFRLPKLASPYSLNTSSPALESFSPALPHAPGSSALSSPFSNRSFPIPTDDSSLENLPSFSKQPSLNDKMRFDRF